MPHEDYCLYGTWHQYTPEEKQQKANNIYKRNSANVRKVIDTEQEQVLQKGMIEEHDLRNKKTRQLFGMPTKVIRVKK
jgi:hypothetical protein